RIEHRLTALLSVGYNDIKAVDSSTKDYTDKRLVGLEPFTGVERFVKAGLFYNDTTYYPTSYDREDGLFFSLQYRHSGREMGGDLDRNRVLGEGGFVYSLAPRWGHQIETRATAGWSDGDRYLQGAFAIGGLSYDNVYIPRGYPDTEATGPYFGAYSAAYRLPVYRPFKAFGTTPFEIRQL
ncbi:MAG: hypothetical protein GY771_09785, partial [bacterium]|nr:hypothetical protein [bacterium]